MSSEDSEPLVQFQDYDSDDDNMDEFDPYEGIERTSNKSGRSFGKTCFIIFVVLAAVAVLMSVLGLALGAAGLNKAQPTPQSTNSQVATTSPPDQGKPTVKPVNLVSNPNCGDGLWNRIMFLNMTDPSHECPRGWRGYEGSTRCCGRPVLVRSSCPAVYLPAYGFQFSKVCGRALGYQQGSPDGFASTDSGEPQETVDGIYVDGVSLTHGNPRTHIWTFAAGLLENGNTEINNQHRCPCDGGQDAPDFIGSNYFCETGDHDSVHNLTRFYYEDPLWDGQNCVASTCCRFNTPPWFNVQLPRPTTDDIEVRICGDQGTGDEDTPIALLEIYVQQ